MTIDESKPSATPPRKAHFFQKVDWVSFGLTTLIAFTVYLFTLAPEVTLKYSGVYSTAAMYPSPSMPSGHPVWAICGWLFIKLVPFSNVAWRLGVASATAGALACGLVALMVSRVGFLVAERIPNFKTFSSREQTSCQVVCGGVAGLGLGFDGGFWSKTVVADTWPLNVFLFALTICLLSRWFFLPHHRRYLYLAAFIHGLTLSESQAFVPATLAFPFLLTLGDPKLGQQIFLGVSVCLVAILLMKDSLQTLGWHIGTSSRNIILGATAITMLSWGGLWFWTRRFFCRWKAASGCAALFLGGISFYLLLPVFSMTNPPINWGYPRTVEGFFHVLSRGQFESFNPSSSFNQLLMQWKIYCKIAAFDLGPIYLIAAAIPFFLLHKASSPVRMWLVGLLVVWFFISLLMLLGLNVDNYGAQHVRPFFIPTHLILAMLAGYGLMLFAAIIGRPIAAKS